MGVHFQAPPKSNINKLKTKDLMNWKARNFVRGTTEIRTHARARMGAKKNTGSRKRCKNAKLCPDLEELGGDGQKRHNGKKKNTRNKTDTWSTRTTPHAGWGTALARRHRTTGPPRSARSWCIARRRRSAPPAYWPPTHNKPPNVVCGGGRLFLITMGAMHAHTGRV